MTERERLVEILKKPIYPRLDADPNEVVADYLLDNGVICLGFPISHKERNKLKHIALADRKLKERENK